MALITFHEWDADGKHYRAVYDEDYQPDKCCGATGKGKHNGDEKGLYCERDGGTSESCERFYQEEVDKLRDGDWVALGVIVTKPCGGVIVDEDGASGKHVEHCRACSGTVQIDSLWGIVVENSNKAIEEFVKEQMA